MSNISDKAEREIVKLNTNVDSSIYEKVIMFVDSIKDNLKFSIKDSLKFRNGWIELDFKMLMEYDPGLAEYLIDNFVDANNAFIYYLKEINIDIDQLNIRWLNLSKTLHKGIAELRADADNQLVLVEGTIRRKGDIMQVIRSVLWECPSCGELIRVMYSPMNYSDLNRCGCGRKGKFKALETKLYDIQRIIVEEDSEHVVGTNQPKKLMLLLKEDLCSKEIDNKFTSSKKVMATGIIKRKQAKKSKGSWDQYLDVNNLKLIDDDSTRTHYTKEDIKQFRKVASTPTLFLDLAQSILPTISGCESVKEAILLQIVGGSELQLNKSLEERGQIHMLLVGSPGTAKSKILQGAVKFLPGARFASGGRTVSGVGLVAAVVKDDELGGWCLDLGAVALAKNLIAIDELDKTNKTDLEFLNNAMVDLQVVIDKASVHAVVKTPVSILAAANPKNRVFDKFEPIWKQIGLSKDFLDRFDLIFPIEAPKTDESKREIAEVIVGKYQKDSEIIKPVYDYDFMSKYIAYARQIKTDMSDDVKEYMITNFINLVKPSDPNEDSYYFSFRLLTNIIRLAQATSKVRLSSKITVDDAKYAIDLLITSLKAQDIITVDGLMDYFKLEAITPKKKRSKIKTISTIIKDLQDATDEKMVEYDEAIKFIMAAIKDIDEADIEQLLDKMKQNGDIMEPRRGFLKLL